MTISQLNNGHKFNYRSILKDAHVMEPHFAEQQFVFSLFLHVCANTAPDFSVDFCLLTNACVEPTKQCFWLGLG